MGGHDISVVPSITFSVTNSKVLSFSFQDVTFQDSFSLKSQLRRGNVDMKEKHKCSKMSQQHR